jgi:hypothetical protein
MPSTSTCTLSDKAVFLLLVAWLAFIVFLSLVFGCTSGYREGLTTFAFGKVPAKAECCSSLNNLYSTSNGCLCLSEEEKNMISTRGGNRT